MVCPITQGDHKNITLTLRYLGNVTDCQLLLLYSQARSVAEGVRNTLFSAYLKPNSITLAGSKLVRTIQRNGIWLLLYEKSHLKASETVLFDKPRAASYQRSAATASVSCTVSEILLLLQRTWLPTCHFEKSFVFNTITVMDSVCLTIPG